MNYGSGEPGEIGEVGRVALGIAVIPGAGEEEVAGEADGLGGAVWRGALGFDGPGGLLRRPGSADDAMAEADVAVDAFVAGGGDDVFADFGAGGDRFGAGPGAEGVAHGEHVGVGTNAGITKEVPGAADAFALLEEDVGFGGADGVEVMGGVDAGKAGAHDHHVEMFGCCGARRHSLIFHFAGRNGNRILGRWRRSETRTTTGYTSGSGYVCGRGGKDSDEGSIQSQRGAESGGLGGDHGDD